MWSLRSSLFLVPGFAASVGAVLCVSRKKNIKPQTHLERYSTHRENGTVLLVTESKKQEQFNRKMLREAKEFLNNHVREGTLDGTNVRPEKSPIRLDNQTKGKIQLSIISENGNVGEPQEFFNYQLQQGNSSFSTTLLPAKRHEQPPVEVIKLGIIHSAEHKQKVLIPANTQLCQIQDMQEVTIQNHNNN